jgi:two-component system response regulator PilR (NtrC family)
MAEPVRTRLLLVDDDDLFCMAIDDLLAELEVEIVRASSLAEARGVISGLAASSFDVVVLDDYLPDGRGIDLLDALRVLAVQPRVVVVSGSPNIDMAVAALRFRALDFLYKPIDPEALLRLVQAARPAHARASRQIDAELDAQQLRYAASDAPLLLRGETGTGKTSLARRLHAASPRAAGPFVAVNCGALPEALIEAELFGNERGAYTGAGVARVGLIESATGGTFFLDEIGELPLVCQAKLLDVIESKCLRRLGAVSPRQVDVRFMAATHVDLEAAAEARRFRRDLLFRLDVLCIELPALRECPEALPALIVALMRALEITRPLADGELERLAAHDWPGNIRELRNLLQRSIMAQPDGELAPSALLAARSAPRSKSGQGLRLHAQGDATVDEIALRHMTEVVARSPTRKQAAAVLGIGESTLRRKLKQAAQSARFERLP